MALTDEQLNSVNVFFLLAFMDETLARSATLKFATEFERRDPQELSFGAFFVLRSKKIWEGLQHRSRTVGLLRDRVWSRTNDLDLSAWREFKKQASPEELLTTLWRDVLGLPEDEIARGLNTTIGTLRHRLSDAHRHLGQALAPGGSYG